MVTVTSRRDNVREDWGGGWREGKRYYGEREGLKEGETERGRDREMEEQRGGRTRDRERVKQKEGWMEG